MLFLLDPLAQKKGKLLLFSIVAKACCKGVSTENYLWITSRNCPLVDLNFSDSRIKWDFLADAILTKVSPARSMPMLTWKQQWIFSISETYTAAYIFRKLSFAKTVQQNSYYHEGKQPCGGKIAQVLISMVYTQLLACSKSAFFLYSQNT